eukprot:CAMPEP_0176495714 /NCGR_PEP_ID=MMETSP0200_2-20121128/10810_1 /TAXON_ID=947934 /ORGANISM="Chaetoceros sp., Strain GSL56" /LENGTH=701 /DNA_ID=CAMNT_0017893623 /DNA_START=966 /DNA_END=3071 /DNA_ORIENTATION=+
MRSMMCVISTLLFLLTCANGAFLPLRFVSEERNMRQSSSFILKASMTDSSPPPPSTSLSTTIQEGKRYETDVSLLFSRTAKISGVALDLAIPFVSCIVSQSIHNASNRDKDIHNDDDDEDDWWESFWSSTTRYKSNDFQSNAQRVVEAMEKLGPTYVKFGQALASRPDIIPKYLAESLSALQDQMETFDTATAKDIIEKELRGANVEEVRIAILLDSLSCEPVAAASVGQVYKGYLLDVGEVAVKVQRPGIRDMVEKDAALLQTLARVVESIPSPNFNGRKLVNTKVRAAVDEFMSRIFEELDYTNEASNAKKFAGLYSNKYGSARKALPGKGVVVPEIISDYCTENVLVMEWISGRKLTSLGNDTDTLNSSKRTSNNDDHTRREYLKEKKENLALVEQALYVTLSQLLEHGCMHADPHGGNLLKVLPQTSSGSTFRAAAQVAKPTLAYLDFGLLATIPEQVRDGLVCAVSQLVFAKDVEAVASLFGELDLMPQDILNDPVERAALTSVLSKTLEEVLIYPTTRWDENIPSKNQSQRSTETTEIPKLKFDKLLDGLVRLVPRFQFQLPPYFINNARALGTLEGVARSLDPNFNAFSLMYPYALNRILQNPSGSPVVEATLQNMIRCKESGKIDGEKIRRLLRDSALFTGFSKRRVLGDILKTKSGQRLAKDIIKQTTLGYYRRIKGLLGLGINELSNLLRL